MSDVVIREIRNGAMWLSINRPERRNALNPDVFRLLMQGLDDAMAEQARAVVLTGVGDKAFCAGADLQPGQSFNYDTSRPNTPFGLLLRKVRQLHIPLVARVNGACVAGGMGLLAMCDMAVAARTATFALPEVNIGLFPAQILAALQRVVPRRKLVEWCVTGATFGADQAMAHGLLNDVSDDLDGTLGQLLDQVTSKSPAVVRRGLYMMNSMEDMAFDDSVAFAESQIPLFAQTDDAKEGRLAFREKRKPVWSSR